MFTNAIPAKHFLETVLLALVLGEMAIHLHVIVKMDFTILESPIVPRALIIVLYVLEQARIALNVHK